MLLSASGQVQAQPQSSYEVISTNANLTILKAAIDTAGLNGTLSNTSLAWTVFAPTNDVGAARRSHSSRSLSPARLHGPPLRPHPPATIVRFQPDPLLHTSWRVSHTLKTCLATLYCHSCLLPLACPCPRQAFTAAFAALQWSGRTVEEILQFRFQRADLQALLLYHVLPGAYNAASIPEAVTALTTQA